MPIIDLQCHLGVNAETRAVRPPTLAQAAQYADERGVEMMCFSASRALTDMDGGNAELSQALQSDKRFRGWLNLSVHQADKAQELAKNYLNKRVWVGTRFEQNTADEAVSDAGGFALLNALRRYGKPVLLVMHSSAALHVSIEAARQFHNMRFLISPQSADLTADALPAIRETLNISLLPCAAYVERDIIAQAVATIGERRVLWASDWGKLNPSAALGMLSESAVSVPFKQRIGYKNAQEMLSATQ